MGRLVEFAKSEMEHAWPESDEIQDMVKANILQLMQVVEDQGHSGFSIGYVMSVFKRLVQFKPLKPLTWPFSDLDWKPTDVRRNLVKAAALLLAEIERIDNTTK